MAEYGATEVYLYQIDPKDILPSYIQQRMAEEQLLMNLYNKLS